MARINNAMVEGTQGKVGKELVYKKRNKKTFVSKMPDMSNIIATKEQAKNRNVFAEAVKFARELKNDPVRSAAFKLRKGETLYLAAITEYMRMHGNKKVSGTFDSKYWYDRLEKAGLSKRQVNAALHIKRTGKLSNEDCQKMNNISKATATRDLQLLSRKKIIEFNGVRGAGAFYIMGSWWEKFGS
jgi:predicted HTH transcriptional regulator